MPVLPCLQHSLIELAYSHVWILTEPCCPSILRCCILHALRLEENATGVSSLLVGQPWADMDNLLARRLQEVPQSLKMAIRIYPGVPFCLSPSANCKGVHYCRKGRVSCHSLGIWHHACVKLRLLC